MRRLLPLWVCLCCCLALPACHFASAVAFGPGGDPREPGQVRVFAGTEADRPYEIVGLVVLQHDGYEPDAILYEVRRLAAAMGADAVVDLQLRLGFGFWSVGHHVTGTAVRYQ